MVIQISKKPVFYAVFIDDFAFFGNCPHSASCPDQEKNLSASGSASTFVTSRRITVWHKEPENASPADPIDFVFDGFQ
jgi:hypothetical protein